MMWQEARKQERKIRGMLVDYKKRAERRKDYYEKIKADPTQFIQLHGRPCKIHLDPAIAVAADSPANMMPWQGNQDILIDRFDVRAHLDHIPEIPATQEERDLDYENRQINYERYRILVQNDFLGVTEEKFLHQLMIEEQFGPIEKVEPPPIEGKKKVPGAAIGYNYNEGTVVSSPVEEVVSDLEEEDDDEDSDIDFDLCVDVNKMGPQQAHEMNACSHSYGMTSNDFFSFLTKDVEEAENLKMAREREEEKAMYSGRKSRRERRAYREKKLIGRKISPPSYASKSGPGKDTLLTSPSKSVSKSRSRSITPINTGQITYITSFGGEEIQDISSQLPKSSTQKDEIIYKRTVRYRSRSRSQSAKRRITCRGESRSRSRGRTKSRSQNRQTRSRSRGRRSRSRGYKSRSPTSRSRSHRAIPRSSSKRSPYYKKYHSSRSRSRSKSSHKVITRKASKSPSPVQRNVVVPAPPIITRYYGRHKNNSSSSELGLSDSDKESSEKNVTTSEKNERTGLGNSIGRNKQPIIGPVVKMTPQERLKRKMQILLNRQYKADKRAERVRLEKAEQERQDREDEMREISIKMRRRERQKRHQYNEYNENLGEVEPDGHNSSASSQSGLASSSPEPEPRHEENLDRHSRDLEKVKEKRNKHNREERDKGSKHERDKERGNRQERDRDGRHEKDRDGRQERNRDSRQDRDRDRDRDRDGRQERDKEIRKERDRQERDSRSRGDSRDTKGRRSSGDSHGGDHRSRDSNWDNGNSSRSKAEIWNRKDHRGKDGNRSKDENRDKISDRSSRSIRSRGNSRDRDYERLRSRHDSRSKVSRDREYPDSRNRGDSSKSETSKKVRPLVDY